jgi:hypothetical protein
MCRVGQNHTCIYGVYTVFLAGVPLNIRSYKTYYMVLASPTYEHTVFKRIKPNLVTPSKRTKLFPCTLIMRHVWV